MFVRKVGLCALSVPLVIFSCGVDQNFIYSEQTGKFTPFPLCFRFSQKLLFFTIIQTQDKRAKTSCHNWFFWILFFNGNNRFSVIDDKFSERISPFLVSFDFSFFFDLPNKYFRYLKLQSFKYLFNERNSV